MSNSTDWKFYTGGLVFVFRIFDPVEKKFCSSGATLYGRGRSIWANKSGVVNALNNMPDDIKGRLEIKKFQLEEVVDGETKP
jgi:hypothetical protein